MPPTAVVVAALAVVLQSSCNGRTDPPPAASPAANSNVTDTTPTSIYREQQSGWRTATEQVIRDRGAWEAAWRTLHGGVAENAAPEVNFERRMVVLVALGEMSTGGYAVDIQGVVPGDAATVVRYTVTQPGPGCMTSQAITTPVAVASAPRATGAVRFERRVVRETC